MVGRIYFEPNNNQREPMWTIPIDLIKYEEKIAKLESQLRWTPVIESLPEKGKCVLVYDMNDWGVAWVNHIGDWVTDDGDHINASHIAYWLPVPKLPQVKHD